MARAVIFDCFGVLCGSSIEILLAKCPPDRVDELRNLNKQMDYGYISGHDYVDGVATLLGWTPDQTRSVMKQARARNEELIAFVKQLRGSGVTTALLSNVGSQTLQGLFGDGELESMFDVQVLSYQERLAKPNPAIFELVAQRLAVDPEACLMVDDRPENCDGAEVAGLESQLHTTNSQTIERVRQWVEYA